MNKIIKRSLFFAGFFAVLFFAACTDDIADEITEIQTSRLFSPTDLEVRVVNQTSLRLSWKSVKNAVSYNVDVHENGVLDFSGTPVKTLEGITFNQLPLTIPGFDGATAYSVRVKAVGEGIAESTWISASFTTDLEQIFMAIDPEEITATGVTLRWPAGEFATEIVLNPGDIHHPVTADEIAAGAAVITDLASDTEYTAVLMNLDKVRGTIQFTTLIAGAIIVYPTDNLKEIIEAANEGDVFALMPGEYNIVDDIFINTTIGIVAEVPVDRPVINGATLKMKAGSGLRLKDLVLDGTLAITGNQTIVYEDPQAYGDVLIEDCLIRNYVKGTFYVNVAASIESVTIRGNIYQGIITSGGDFIDFRQGIAKKFDFINNTVYNSCADRDLFRMDAGGSTNFPDITSIITISNNTFYNVTAASNRRILYIRLTLHEIYVVKNLFSEVVGSYSNQSSTKVFGFTSNNYHNSPNLYAPTFTVHDAQGYTTLNPGFTDPAAGNFTVSNEDLIFNRIGDPRWLP